MNLKPIKILVAIMCFFTLLSCNDDEGLKNTDQNLSVDSEFFSKNDLSEIKDWMSKQSDLENLKEDFPDLEFKMSPNDISNSELVEFYQNGIMYLNDDIREGQDLNYISIKQQILEDDRLGKGDKKYLLSFCQLSSELLTSKVFTDFTKPLDSDANKSGCDCTPSYNAYYSRWLQCQAYGNVWGHCTAASTYYQLWQSCKSKTTTCPSGFIFDSQNCYSGITIPSGYNPFIWGNGFYVQQNCGISSANNCCPSGYGYDGANCHYWGVYFPSNYEPFIWGNSFYVKAKCL